MWRTVLLIVVVAALTGATGLARARLADRAAPPIAPSVSPVRIVSMAPNLTETCFALGLGPRLVGRTSYCDYPPQVIDIADVGALLDPNLERLLLLRPDLVIVPATGRDLRGFLDAAGIRYLALPNDTLEDVFTCIRTIGRRCGVESRAEALERDLRGRIAAIAQRRRPRRPLRVLLCITASRFPMPPPWVAGPKSYLGTLVARLHHVAVPDDLDRAYAEISLEQVRATDPDVIIEFRGLAGEPPDIAVDPAAAWATIGDLAAVRHRRIFTLHGAQHVVPGPRFVQTLEQLAVLLNSEDDSSRAGR